MGTGRTASHRAPFFSYQQDRMDHLTKVDEGSSVEAVRARSMKTGSSKVEGRQQ